MPRFPPPNSIVPIVELEFILSDAETLAPDLPTDLAIALASVFAAPPGRVWVRVRSLPAAQYAENGATLRADELPVFVTVLLAHPPEGEARARQAEDLCAAVARVARRARDRVHLVYEPPAAGRVAFGGRLVGYPAEDHRRER